MSISNLKYDLLLKTKDNKEIKYNSHLFSLISNEFNDMLKINNNFNNSNDLIKYNINIDIEYEILKIILKYYNSKNSIIKNNKEYDIILCAKIYNAAEMHNMKDLQKYMNEIICRDNFISLFVPQFNINNY